MSTKLRLLVSAIVSFAFYFAWAYFANSLVTDNQGVLLRAALVQGLTSSTITLLFTVGLEKSVKAFGGNYYSLVFITPILCSVHSKTPHNIAIFNTFNSALDLSAKYLKGVCLAGTLLAPLLPLAMQASIAIGVNVLNQTPNLWLTVAPSILLTGIYGYTYTFTLLKERPAAVA